MRRDPPSPASARQKPELRRLYDGHAQPLYAFLLNLTRDEADTRDLLQDIFVKLARDQFAAESLSPFAPASDPDEQTFRAALAEALVELPPELRAVVHLKLWEGLPFEEIAHTLDIPANTAASRYRYGLDKLRERLRPLYEEIK